MSKMPVPISVSDAGSGVIAVVVNGGDGSGELVLVDLSCRADGCHDEGASHLICASQIGKRSPRITAQLVGNIQ